MLRRIAQRRAWIRERQLIMYLCLTALVCAPFSAYAEGSKDINHPGKAGARIIAGNRSSGFFDNYVYAEEGEFILFGTSAFLQGTAVIQLTSPQGTTIVFDADSFSDSTGVIFNRVQELNIPGNPAVPSRSESQFKPIEYEVPVGEGGIWTVSFRGPGTSGISYAVGRTLGADVAWERDVTAQAFSTNLVGGSQAGWCRDIFAWDVTVSDHAVSDGDYDASSLKSGRVFTYNIYGHCNASSGRIGYLTTHVLTNSGLRFDVDLNAFRAYDFEFFSNNKGIYDKETGNPVFESGAMDNFDVLTNADHTYHKDLPNEDGNVVYKLFYDDPDATLPTEAPFYFDGTVQSDWLLNTPPAAVNATILGVRGPEGTPGEALIGTGMYIRISLDAPTNFSVIIDANRNGFYGDGYDVELYAQGVTGENEIFWNGRDAYGNTVISAGNNISFDAQLSAGTEVHFPLKDMEELQGGIGINRINGPGAPDNQIYWDDTPMPYGLSYLAGIASPNHWWTETSPDPVLGSYFGDNRLLDTWAKIDLLSASSVFQSFSFDARETRLTLSAIGYGIAELCTGDTTIIEVVTDNAGPSLSDSTHTVVAFPSSVSHVEYIGTRSDDYGTRNVYATALTQDTFRGEASMGNFSRVTYRFKVYTGDIPGGTLEVKAGIMRSRDAYDPGATNGDPAFPLSPSLDQIEDECFGFCDNVLTKSFDLKQSPVVGALAQAGDNCGSYALGDIQITETTGQAGWQATFHSDEPGSAADNSNQIFTSVGSSQWVWVRVNDATGACHDVDSVFLEVNHQPVISSVTPVGLQCDSFEVDDLQFTWNATGGFDTTYHSSAPSSAADMTNQLTLNAVSASQYVYIMVANAVTGCYDVANVYVQIQPKPYFEIEDPEGPLCQQFNVSDLNLINQENMSGIGVTYHDYLPGDYGVGSNVSVVTSPTTVYVLGGVSGCYHVDSVDLNVGPQPELSATVPYYETCGPYDLNRVVFTGSDLDLYKKSFHSALPANGFDFSAQLPVDSIFGSQMVYIMLSDSSTGCHDIDSIFFQLNPQPYFELNPADEVLCGSLAVSDLTWSNAVNLETMNMTFHSSRPTGAGVASDLVLVEQSMRIYAMASNATTGCFYVDSLDVVVHPQPEITAIADPGKQCDEFDLNDLNVSITNGAGMSLTFHSALPTSGTDVSAQLISLVLEESQEVYVRIADPVSGCYAVDSIELEINASPRFEIEIEEDGYCGVFSTSSIALINVEHGAGTQVTYHANYPLSADAATDLLQLEESGTVYVKMWNPTTGCFTVASVEVTVHPQPDFSITGGEDIVHCGPYNLDILPLVDASGHDGFELTFHTEMPLSASDRDNLWDTDIVEEDQVLWVMLSDVASGCYQTISISIDIQPEPNAGVLVQGGITVCNNEVVLNLFDGLVDNTFDLGGRWVSVSDGPTIFDGYKIDPSAAANNGAYAYVYVIDAIPPCTVNDSANVWVYIEEAPDAGEPGDAFITCSAGGAHVALNDLLEGEQPGGTWELTAGNALPGSLYLGVDQGWYFSPQENVAGTYTFKYTKTLCGKDDETFVQVVVEDGTDSDNDGLRDAFEDQYGDTDGDGILNKFDLDSDNDGLPDAYEAGLIQDTCNPEPLDTDGDGDYNYYDLDSDGDGIFDLAESGLQREIYDTDADGRIDDSFEVGENGLADVLEASEDAGILAEAIVDTDRDGLDDNRDQDADDDGILDIKEDSGNGYGRDFDGDGVEDYRDLDSDQDGLSDLFEAGIGDFDQSNGGVLDGPDADQDGVKAAVDADEGGVDLIPADTDEDGLGNHVDLDSDNDGLCDLLEAGIVAGVTTVQLSFDDSDQDGIYDGLDAHTGHGGLESEDLHNQDGDAQVDYTDLDSDNDGLFDVFESRALQLSILGRVVEPVWEDADENGLHDPLSGLGVDFDQDGIRDDQDLDSDNDGIYDVLEGEVLLVSASGTIEDWTDANADGAHDELTKQSVLDADGDGLYDHTDLDADQDGIGDLFESGAQDLDQDDNGVVDGSVVNDFGLRPAVDPDLGGTGVAPVDTDGDGNWDAKDLDSDNDALPDVYEWSGTEVGRSVLNLSDEDQDGIADAVDEALGFYGGIAAQFRDFDGDGVYNALDLDSDNDGIADLIEAGHWDKDTPDTKGAVAGNDDDDDGIMDQVDAEAGSFGGWLLSNWYGLNVDGDDYDNYEDYDSDGDDIPDIVENLDAGLDPNQLDADQDGKVDDTQDDDFDGIMSVYDPREQEWGYFQNELINSDGDNFLPDFVDLDSDDDNLPDEEEIGYNPYEPQDDDKDGVWDFQDPLDPLWIPQTFSPNGDDANEVFWITGLKRYPENKFLVYNRWGTQVYGAAPYENNWDGTTNSSMQLGDQAPSGTYYFVLDLGDGSEPRKGYIYLNR